MKLLVLGKGFLGKEFEKYGFLVLTRTHFNYTENQIIGHKFWEELRKTDAVVNCVAISDTRLCETEFNEALRVNAGFVKLLSNICYQHNKKFVHISTGCLYDDFNGPNSETNFMAAHCNYTVSKWVGEKQCIQSDLILRPRLLFSDVADKNNLLCKLPKFKHFVYDMQDSLTRTSTIVEATQALLAANTSGIFNVAEDGSASIAQIAEWCQIPNSNNRTTIKYLRSEQKIHLVNNIMDLTKLKQFYKPKNLKDQIISCYKKLYEIR